MLKLVMRDGDLFEGETFLDLVRAMKGATMFSDVKNVLEYVAVVQRRAHEMEGLELNVTGDKIDERCESLVRELARVKVEAQQREAEARGEADARIAKAIGEAEYIRVVTEAQVAANKDIAESLTPAVLQYILLDRLGEDIKVMVIPSGQGLDLVLPDLQP